MIYLSPSTIHYSLPSQGVSHDLVTAAGHISNVLVRELIERAKAWRLTDARRDPLRCTVCQWSW
jgi:hypothetical protein